MRVIILWGWKLSFNTRFMLHQYLLSTIIHPYIGLWCIFTFEMTRDKCKYLSFSRTKWKPPMVSLLELIGPWIYHINGEGIHKSLGFIQIVGIDSCRGIITGGAWCITPIVWQLNQMDNSISILQSLT